MGFGGLFRDDRVSLISVLDMPRAMSVSTSSSRGVSGLCGGPTGAVARAGGRLVKSAISRLVTDGASSGVARGDHPNRVHQLGGRGVLEQEPARAGAQRLVHVLVEVEGGEHEDSAACGLAGARSSRVACRPSSTGIRTSISTTSGRVCLASRTASAPSAAWPTTAMPGWAASSAPNPSRTIAWSSAMRQLIMAPRLDRLCRSSGGRRGRRSRRRARDRPAAARRAA